jgi:hypothetical protein
MLPSSASSFSLILREAASEISDIEKNALTAIRQSITKILFNIVYPASRQILGREVDNACGKHKTGPKALAGYNTGSIA